MKKSSLLIISVFFTVLLGACDLVFESESGHGKIEHINFEPGTVYTYSRILMMTDSTHSDTLEIIANDTLQVSVHREFNIDKLANTLRFEVLDTQAGYFTETWYLNSGDKLLELASRNAGHNPPVQPKTASANGFDFETAGPVPSLLFQTIKTEQADTDDLNNSVIFRDQPRIVYDYPMRDGKNWVSFFEPFTVTRTVVDLEAASVSGRDQFLARIRDDIQLYNDFSGDFTIEEWVGENGMHSRVITTSQTFIQPHFKKDTAPNNFYMLDITELISLYAPD